MLLVPNVPLKEKKTDEIPVLKHWIHKLQLVEVYWYDKFIYPYSNFDTTWLFIRRKLLLSCMSFLL